MGRYCVDITGKRFGKLVAVRFFEVRNNFHYWLFHCDCGNEKVMCKAKVTGNNTNSKSCGCRRKPHGMWDSRINRTWRNLRKRCYAKYNPSYKYYGAKGVKVCERWNKFSNFFIDMGKSYDEHVSKFGEKNTTIERINPFQDYCPENCKWATYLEQGRNKRKSCPHISLTT